MKTRNRRYASPALPSRTREPPRQAPRQAPRPFVGIPHAPLKTKTRESGPECCEFVRMLAFCVSVSALAALSVIAASNARQ